DIWRVWQRTAKFATNRMVYYNLPRSHFKFHRDFSGKNCPNTLLTAGLANYFQEMADIEYKIWSEYANAQIDFVSHNTDILDHHGRIIAKPDHATAVSYTISVNVNGSTQQRTFTVNVPGTIR